MAVNENPFEASSREILELVKVADQMKPDGHLSAIVVALLLIADELHQIRIAVELE